MNHLRLRLRSRFARAAFNCSIAALAAACGGEGDEGPGSGDSADPAANPDPLAAPGLRNECHQNVYRLLAGNVGDTTAWGGPRSRFREAPEGSPGALAWSPLRASTSGSPNGPFQEGNRSWSSSQSAEADRAKCDPMTALLGHERAGVMDTDSYAAQVLRLDHDVLDFAYPADVGAAAGEGEAVEVKVRSTMTLTFQKPEKKPDGTYDYSSWLNRDEDVQSWALEDVTCERPFTVEAEWRPAAAGADPFATQGPFCRDGAGGRRECLEHVVRYTADKCKFTIREGAFKFVDGAPPVRANVAGHFDRYDDASGAPLGYMVHFTNFEFL